MLVTLNKHKIIYYNEKKDTYEMGDAEFDSHEEAVEFAEEYIKKSTTEYSPYTVVQVNHIFLEDWMTDGE